jgi:hypothetical protein
MVEQETAAAVEVEVYEAASRDESIIAVVGCRGQTLGVQLEAAAMKLGEGDFAYRVIKLNTLAHLRSQLARRREMEGAGFPVSRSLPTAEQVAAYEEMIEF